MERLFRLPGAVARDPAVERWLGARSDEPGAIARRWFAVVREAGDDVREVMHDGRPTACVRDAAFAYVDAYRAHANVGFFRGADLADPDGLLTGDGKAMRRVKLVPGEPIDEPALRGLVAAAYADMKARVAATTTGENPI